MSTRVHTPDEVFFAALEQNSPEARDAYLDEVCRSDLNLRLLVERLLAAQPKVGGFLDAPALGHTVTLGDTQTLESPGTVIGPYKLMEQIGEGGMGAVYMAEQTEPVRRRVALKVIKPGMDSKQIVARFEAERQALAMMDHPNIARVLDGGATDSGRPYFVMELVRGLPITEYCDQEQLSIRDRLDLFVLVCRAVQHAHQKGVIHRDLKPSNVLVTVIDGAAVPKVIDFGVAKATGPALTDKTLFTGFHQFVGTPLYVSPEQADLAGIDVDTRSDIYTLGVLLYELLTGTTPFDSETLKRAAFDEMRRIIREEEPPRPSTRLSTLGERLSTVSARRKADPRRLGASLQGELDWVVMKALEKDRRRRYQTVNDLVADVMRYANDQPIEARPPSAWYRFSKSARHHRLSLTTASLVSVTLVAGTAVSLWQAALARGAQRQAEGERDRAVRAERRASVIGDFLQNDLLAQVGGNRQGAVGSELTVREALDRAAIRISGRFDDEPLVEASIRLTIGRAYQGISRDDLALPHLERSVELRVRHLDHGHPDTLESTHFLAMTLQFTGRLDDAILMLEWLLESRTATLGPDHPSTLLTLNGLGEALRKAGEWGRALPIVEQALERKTALLGPDDPRTLNSLHDLGLIYRDVGFYSEAIEILTRASWGLETMCGIDHPDSVYSLLNLAESYEGAGRPEMANDIRLDIAIRVGGKYLPQLDGVVARWMKQAKALLKQGGYADAEPVLRRCLAVRERAIPDDWRRYYSMNLLGYALLGRGDHDAAGSLLIEGYRGMEQRQSRIPASGKHRLAAASRRVASFYEATGQIEKASHWRDQHPMKEPAETDEP